MSQLNVPNNALAKRRTPRTDAWVATLKTALTEERGRQSELARHLCELAGKAEPDHNDITRWVSAFARWFKRTGLPGVEDYLVIDEWLRNHAKKARRTAK